MKGATAVPCVKTINPPNIKRTKIIGISQNFFLAIIKEINSLKKLMIYYYLS